MTVELRSKQAAAAVHAAVAQVEPRPIVARRRFWRRRATIAIVLAVTAPPAGVALVNAAQDGGRARLITRDTRKPKNARTVGTPGTGSRQAAGATAGPGGVNAAGRRPSSKQTVLSTAAAASATFCVPLITDRKGDVDNPAIDILSSDITYDRAENRLTFVHQMDDIPSTRPPGETLAYRLDFDWGGLTYFVTANSDPTSESSGVYRASRKNPNTGWVSVAVPAARIDRQTDTVTIHVDIDEFNRGERRVAADEGMAPAAELKAGSRLTNISLRASPDYTQYYATQDGPHDAASGCDYVVQEQKEKR